MQSVLNTYDLFSGLPISKQCVVLSLLAHELTIIMREHYELKNDGLDNPCRVRTLNELQHRITSHLSALLRNDSRRFPDEVIGNIIDDDVDCRNAFRRVLEYVDIVT